jgi:hypothetical protein
MQILRFIWEHNHCAVLRDDVSVTKLWQPRQSRCQINLHGRDDMSASSLSRFRSAQSSLIVLILSFLMIISIGCWGGGQNPAPTPTPTQSPAPVPTPTPNQPNTVAVTFLGQAPVAVAEKIGAGNWTSTSLPITGPLQVQLPAGTTQYGIAFVCESVQTATQVNVEWILQADVNDGSSYSLQLCQSNNLSAPPSGTFAGSYDASAIPGAATVNVNMNDDSRGAFFNTATGAFNISAVAGTTDVYATVFDSLNTILAMKIVRSQTVPGIANGGNPITVAASDAVTVQPISLANVSPTFALVIMVPYPSLVTARGSSPVGMHGFPLATQYAVLPPAALQPGDYYAFNVEAGVGNQNVLTRQYRTTTGPVTMTVPTPWAATPPTPAAFPTFTFDYTGFAGQPAIADSAAISWTQGSIASAIEVVSTANHQNGATTLTIPDLTALPGFLPKAPSGSAIHWSLITWGGTTQFYLGTTAVPQTLSNASDQGDYTQP